MPRAAQQVPWLDQRNGVYGVNSYDPETRRTKRVGLRTRDAREAQARYAAILQGLDQQLNLWPAADAGITVTQALDAYYREHVSAKVGDKLRQEIAIGHLKTWFGTMALSSIDIPACRGYADARRQGLIGGGRRNPDKRGSDSTIRRELGVLRAATQHAVRWKRLRLDVMPTFEIPSEPNNRDEAPWFTPAEIEDLIVAAPEPLRSFIQLAYWTGARKQSIVTLETGQVKLDTGRLHLDKPGAAVTKKRRPIVPIYPEMRPVLERLVAGAQRGWLFPKGFDVYHPFAKLCARLDMADKGHPHVLRHSRATHMLMAGESIYKVARLLGDTVATVERVYGHFSPEYLAEQKERAK